MEERTVPIPDRRMEERRFPFQAKQIVRTCGTEAIPIALERMTQPSIGARIKHTHIKLSLHSAKTALF